MAKRKKRTGPKPMKPIGEIAAELEKLREARGWSVTKWAGLLGMSRTAYLECRRGHTPLRPEALLLYARIAASDRRI